jgi:hypothetical protein
MTACTAVERASAQSVPRSLSTMKATNYYSVCSAFSVLALAISAFPAESIKKNPVPSDTAQTEATRLVKEIYGDEYAKAKTPAQKQSLARKLLAKAGETADDLAGKFVLLRLTKDIAAQATDGQTAFEAIDATAESFAIDAAEMKAAVLQKLATVANTAAHHRSISEQAVKLMNDAVANDDFSIAERLGQLAQDEAAKGRDRELVAQAKGQIDQAKRVAKAFEKTKSANGVLDNAPDDPQANLIVGKYLCLIKGDWKRGLPKLALAADGSLKTLATQELDPPASSAEQARLGDAWWNTAEQEEGTAKRQLQARAGYWYQTALPGLSGLMKDKVERRLAITASTTNKFPSGFVDLLPFVNAQRDRVAGDWQKDKSGLRLVTGLHDGYTRVMLPVSVDGEYDFAVTFTRNSGDDCICPILPVGSHMCLVNLSGWGGKCSGIEMLDGQDSSHNSTTIRPGGLINGRKYHLLIRVRLQNGMASVDVLIDKAPVLRWRGSESSLSLYKDWSLPQLHRLALGARHPTTFHSIQLKMISGKAEWIK